MGLKYITIYKDKIFTENIDNQLISPNTLSFEKILHYLLTTKFNFYDFKPVF